MKMRTAAAVALLGILAVIAARLAPPYVRNHQLKAYLEQMARSPEAAALPAEMVRIRVLERARQLGLPVRGEQVRVDRDSSSTSIELRYVVPVDIYVSTVDLHFRPRARWR